VDLIRQERFSEALAFLRSQPREARSWRGTRSLEAALVSRDAPAEALLIYDEILNSDERELHWTRALGGYRHLLRDLSAKGDGRAVLRLVKCLAFEWKNQEALALAETALADLSLPEDLRKEIALQEAILSVRVGDFAKARELFATRTDRAALRWLSTIALREGDPLKAAEYREAAAMTLKGRQRLSELSKVFDILAKGGKTEEAERLLAARPELKDRVPDWSYYLGISRMAAGEPEKALDYFESEREKGGERGQRAAYFKGRAFEDLLMYREASECYAQAAKGPPGYYAMLASGRFRSLNRVERGEPPTAFLLARLLTSPTGRDEDSLGFYLWVTDRVPPPWPDHVEAPVKAGPGEEGRARAAIFLHWEAGDRAAAMDELRHSRELLKTGGGGGDFARRLSLMAAYAGEPRLAVLLMRNFKAGPVYPENTRWNHPLVFGGEILEAYRLYGIPPQLVLALIRSESAFQSGAVSRSNARGLTQLLPATAERIAELLGEEPVNEEELFDPEINIRYGTFYLSLLLDSFQSLPLALASYNGGPRNVLRTVKAREGLAEDVFVETFPFPETSAYVRNVLSAAHAYELAYLGEGAGPDLSRPVKLPEKSPPDF
jgi:soluble lytic murein transglycosylase